MSIVAIVRYITAFSAQFSLHPGCNGLTVPDRLVR
ncbi:hypothetical protein B1M_20243 [Burkholderia sp. TJI49]|nr:hypothetical protein B1M_20243 [Burkholderia sp. TJI49]